MKKLSCFKRRAVDKQFTLRSVLFSLAGLMLNVLLVTLTSRWSIPLYLDCIGTLLVAALCGVIPGITVGFLSNVLTAMLTVSADPLTMYFSLLSILLALAATIFSLRGWLRRLTTALLLVPILASIGGGLGSLLTWMLYGFSFGSGITAPLAVRLFQSGFSEWAAQLTASLAVDLADKLIAVAALFLFLRFVPYRFIGKLPLGYIYDRSKPYIYDPSHRDKLYRKRSLRTKIIAIVLAVAALLSGVAITASAISYRRMLVEEYTEKCFNVARMVSAYVDGDQIDAYLQSGGQSAAYEQVKAQLEQMLSKVEKIKYIYVYRIEPEGCRVIFDLDSGDVPGEAPNAMVDFDDAFIALVPSLLKGEAIPAVITDGSYGWLLTAYEPVYDSNGRCAAYACADIEMTEINRQQYTFIIRLGALLFSAFIVMIIFSMLYFGQVVLEPIGALVERTHAFDPDDPDKPILQKPIATGDELEALYDSICEKDERIGGYIKEINHKNSELTQLQRNVIYSLANMTESRDENTGNHIKRTAAYVRAIAVRLQQTGYGGGVITDDVIRQLYESAPLHDIGKIRISDAILNKPGKLTPEEFAIMKTHTTIGGEVLRSSLEGVTDGGSLTMAVDMVECHHEKWDGSGYPHGLAGDDIPLCARIMAVSDVFDALISKRSYKDAMSIDKALGIIRAESGTHFDPDVVRAFLDSEDEIRRIAKL